MIDITPIIQAVFALVGALITAFLIPLIRSKISTEQLGRVQTIVSCAVSAAEQIYSGSGMGKEKKKYVMQYLNDHGYTYDEATVDNLIESAVYALKEGNKV